MTESIAVLIVVLLIFLVGREVVCWYFKINEKISLLKKIERLLRDQ